MSKVRPTSWPLRSQPSWSSDIIVEWELIEHNVLEVSGGNSLALKKSPPCGPPHG